MSRARRPTRCARRGCPGPDARAPGARSRVSRNAARASAASAGPVADRGQRAGLDEQPVALDLPLALEERLERRPRRDTAVLVEGAAVAGAAEEAAVAPARDRA